MFCINFHFLGQKKKKKGWGRGTYIQQALDAFNLRGPELSGDWF